MLVGPTLLPTRMVTQYKYATNISHLLPVPLCEHLLLLPALELSGAGGEARPHLPHDLAHLVGVEVVRRVPDLVTRYGQL